MEKIYYVYFHRRETDNTIFYIGKGKGTRAWNKTRKNKEWQEIVFRCGLKIEIVERQLTEAEALKKESFYISMIGRENLVNKTSGGQGTSGYKMPQEHKDKISLSLLKSSNKPGVKKGNIPWNKNKTGYKSKHKGPTKKYDYTWTIKGRPAEWKVCIKCENGFLRRMDYKNIKCNSCSRKHPKIK